MSLVAIPNTVTFISMFFGFASIVMSGNHHFLTASIFILLSMLFDMLDGRIARMIKKENPIGKDLDSLADLIAFGIAPGMLFYNYITDISGFQNNWFIALSFLFPLCAAYRLARFNVTVSTNAFNGMPSTSAGGTLALIISFEQFSTLIPVPFLQFEIPAAFKIGSFILIALLMTTRIRFPKPQSLFLSGKTVHKPFILLLNVLFLGLMIVFFKYAAFVSFSLYIIYSIAAAARRQIKKFISDPKSMKLRKVT